MPALHKLKPGQIGRVTEIDGNGALYQRILEMGILEGELIEVIRTALMGDPIEIRIGDYQLSVRKSEAACIQVQPVSPEAIKP